MTNNLLQLLHRTHLALVMSYTGNGCEEETCSIFRSERFLSGIFLRHGRGLALEKPISSIPLQEYFLYHQRIKSRTDVLRLIG